INYLMSFRRKASSAPKPQEPSIQYTMPMCQIHLFQQCGACARHLEPSAGRGLYGGRGLCDGARALRWREGSAMARGLCDGARALRWREGSAMARGLCDACGSAMREACVSEDSAVGEDSICEDV